MTPPDTSLAARLDRLRDLYIANCKDAATQRNYYALLEVSHRAGQLITLADHERAVQSAVAKLREQDERGLTDGVLITVLQHRLDMMDAVAKAVEAEAAIWREAVDQHSGVMAAKYTASKAAAIRSRGVEA